MLNFRIWNRMLKLSSMAFSVLGMCVSEILSLSFLSLSHSIFLCNIWCVRMLKHECNSTVKCDAQIFALHCSKTNGFRRNISRLFYCHLKCLNLNGVEHQLEWSYLLLRLLSKSSTCNLSCDTIHSLFLSILNMHLPLY